MRQGTIVTVRPQGHPLSVFEAKRQLRIEAEDTDQDDHIASLCAAAHSHIERSLGYPILRQTRETHLAQFPCGPIWLGAGEGLTVLQVRYADTAGAVQVLPTNAWALDAVSRIAKLWPVSSDGSGSGTWPSTSVRPSAVVVEWQAGWATPADVPDDLLHAMKLLVGHWDQNREAVVVGSINSDLRVALDDLLSPFRLPFIA